MKTLLCTLFTIFFGIILFGQTPVPEGAISGTWTVSGSPYLIEGETAILDGTTLIIEAGVDVIWQNDSCPMWVHGYIIAEGTESDSILFTAADPQEGWGNIRFIDTPVGNDSSRFKYCIFEYGITYGNNPNNSGGAILAVNFGKLIIDHCSFLNNKAMDININPNPIGGAIALSNSSPVISNCIFKNNHSYAGGAIGCFYEASPQIENNVFTNNVAFGQEYAQGYGGAITCYLSCSPLIRNNTFTGNAARNGGGAIALVSQCNPTIDHNLIFGNSSEWLGGGIEVQDTCSPNIINNTIVFNNAEYGGGIDFWGKSEAKIRNTILWGNVASTEGSQVYLWDTLSKPDFEYCDIEGGQEAFGGATHLGKYIECFDKDPLFDGPPNYCITWANAPDQDTTMSPCIDTGDPSMIDPDSTRCDVGYCYYDQFWIGISDNRFQKSGISIECWPNPSSGVFNIRYSISDIRNVKISIYDLTGNQIKVLANKTQLPGEHVLSMDISDLPAGLYVISLQTEKESALEKVLVVH